MENANWILTCSKRKIYVVGDTLVRDNVEYVINHLEPPHKFSASGRIYVTTKGTNQRYCYYVTVFDLRFKQV